MDFLSGPVGGLPPLALSGGHAYSGADSFASNRGDFTYSAPFTFGGSGGVNTAGEGAMQTLIVGAIILGAILLWRRT